MLGKALTIAAAATLAAAARPANESICDYYTTALLTNNTAANQYSLLTLVVNTAVIGNYTKPNVGIKVPGILNPNGTYNGVAVNLVPYFDGSLVSTNDNGTAVSVNFLDGGGATPLEMNKPADSDSSAQYTLLTHLYEYFGLLLGCTGVGSTGFPSYAGKPGMYEVHRFMDLDVNEVGYFIEQVGLSAASFGVATADVDAVGTALNTTFGYKCSPAVAVIPDEKELQAICIAEDCPLSPNATCSDYATAVEPKTTTVASATASSNSSSMASATSTMPAVSTGGAAKAMAGFAAAAAGVIAFAL